MLPNPLWFSITFEFDARVYAHCFIPNSLRRQLPLTKTPSWKKELFMDYVDSSLKRFFHQQHHKRKNFDLTYCTYDDGAARDFGRIDQWLHDVIHNGTDTLCLHIISYHGNPYPLPQRVLASQMLNELIVFIRIPFARCLHKYQSSFSTCVDPLSCS